MTNENNIRVVYKAPGAAAEVREVPNTLAAFQEAVGGYIETVTLEDAADKEWFRLSVINR